MSDQVAMREAGVSDWKASETFPVETPVDSKNFKNTCVRICGTLYRLFDLIYKNKRHIRNCVRLYIGTNIRLNF